MSPANPFLQKPFRLGDLGRAVRELLQSPAAHAAYIRPPQSSCRRVATRR